MMQFHKSTIWIGLLCGALCCAYFQSLGSVFSQAILSVLCITTCVVASIVVSQISKAPVCILNESFLVINNQHDQLKVIPRFEIEAVYWESEDESTVLKIRHSGKITSLDRSVANLNVLEQELSKNIK